MLEPASAVEARSVVRIDAVIKDLYQTEERSGDESGNYRQDTGQELSRFITSSLNIHRHNFVTVRLTQ